jgi:hypothetical protein
LGGAVAANNTKVFLGYTIVITAMFLIVVVIKGDPPRWRWGGE